MAKAWQTLVRLLRAQPECEAVADPAALSNEGLVGYLIRHEHAEVRRLLQQVRGLSLKVAQVHGARHPKLRAVADAVCDLDEAVWPHFDDEEASLFQTLAAPTLDRAAARAQLDTMRDEHVVIDQLLARVRDAAEGFLPPAWACTTYHQMLTQLQTLEDRLKRHIALEERLILPRIAE
jgi:regulator of cell morphogenesis and NO signaling